MPQYDETGAANAQSVARRTLMKTAGLGLAAALIGGVPARAQPANAAIWSTEYWANKGDVKLYCFRKRLGAPHAGEAPRPVVFLVHGSSMSARATYDLAVPGAGDYSLMDALARGGFDVWSVDHENYGRSSRTESRASGLTETSDGRPTGRCAAAWRNWEAWRCWCVLT